ncbi:hypothetical protein Syun_008503 [Stephania yunnanensis]|uniref:Uncharacterized protein n=1 Tax=Stephania yunnanensis TaxID=152371 RepID=A0AAP0KEU4_9MAGN
MAFQAQEQEHDDLDQDLEFEFGRITPDSPTSDPSYQGSPADVLFSNGRLLPHVFPSQSRRSISLEQPTSRTSSIGSKDYSLMSSRSNSSNSRSSSSSSGGGMAASLSDCNDKKPMNSGHPNVGSTTGATITRSSSMRTRSARLQPCPSGKKWQFIAVPTPCLASPLERKRSEKGMPQNDRLRSKKQAVLQKSRDHQQSSSFSQRLLKSFVLGCRRCHALEPSKRKKEMLAKTILRTPEQRSA